MLRTLTGSGAAPCLWPSSPLPPHESSTADVPQKRPTSAFSADRATRHKACQPTRPAPADTPDNTGTNKELSCYAFTNRNAVPVAICTLLRAIGWNVIHARHLLSDLRFVGNFFARKTSYSNCAQEREGSLISRAYYEKLDRATRPRA